MCSPEKVRRSALYKWTSLWRRHHCALVSIACTLVLCLWVLAAISQTHRHVDTDTQTNTNTGHWTSSSCCMLRTVTSLQKHHAHNFVLSSWSGSFSYLWSLSSISKIQINIYRVQIDRYSNVSTIVFFMMTARAHAQKIQKRSQKHIDKYTKLQATLECQA